jgi:uncharacterized Zn finger protein (UPF0148 family)
MSINSYEETQTVEVVCPNCEHAFDAKLVLTIEMKEPEVDVAVK